jgi:hypothetical protein
LKKWHNVGDDAQKMTQCRAGIVDFFLIFFCLTQFRYLKMTLCRPVVMSFLFWRRYQEIPDVLSFFYDLTSASKIKQGRSDIVSFFSELIPVLKNESMSVTVIFFYEFKSVFKKRHNVFCHFISEFKSASKKWHNVGLTLCNFFTDIKSI